jgi:hypothetical protein
MSEDASTGPRSQPGSTPLPPAVTRPPAATGQWEAGAPLPPFAAFALGERGAPDEAAIGEAASPEAEPAPPDVQLNGLPARAEEAPGGEVFPLDAFFIPEGVEHILAAAPLEFAPAPAGEEDPAADVEAVAERDRGDDRLPPEVELADRLERLARRLRVEGAGALLDPTGREDRLDTLLGGVLAGYLAAGHD